MFFDIAPLIGQNGVLVAFNRNCHAMDEKEGTEKILLERR
jgi:hypothetical protein